MYRQLLSKQPKDNLKTQLQELATNDALITLLPNLHKLACCCLSLPIGTASVERSFSQVKLIKTRIRDSNLEEVVTIWNRKGRRIAV